MKLIIGLGNPGREYEHSRHNFGFAAVEYFAKKNNAKWTFAKKFDAEIAEIELDGEKILLAKPQKFYNLSGEAAQKIREFYKLDNSDILVIHDEMDLPFGQIRTRHGGSDAGNNGVKNLIANLGENFSRIRIGSGVRETVHDGKARPDDAGRDYVLARLSREEKKIFAEELPTIAQIITDFANGDFRETTHKTE